MKPALRITCSDDDLTLYSVVLFCDSAPEREIRIALWARNWDTAHSRGLALGRVVAVNAIKKLES